jgi:hypothetical protein
VSLLFHPSVAEYFEAVAAVMRHHGYLFRETTGGSVNCRKITNGPYTSPHAHGIALDINPSKNKYRFWVGPIKWGYQTDMPTEMIVDLEKIRTRGGHRVTVWGGRWFNIKDPMHFEPTKCSREQLELGIDWATVVGSGKDGEMSLLPLRQGDGYPKGDRPYKNEDVELVQKMLNKAFAAGITVDGKYGAKTSKMVARHLTTGDDAEGRYLGGKRYERLLDAYLDKIIAQHAKNPDAHHD